MQVDVGMPSKTFPVKFAGVGAFALIVVSPLQPKKATSPIDVSELGSVIVVSPLQP